MNNSVAIVVTYNRKELLRENVLALISQSVKCDVIIVDNDSNDGTYEYIEDLLSDTIIYKNTGANLGGAGGFAFGVSVAEKIGYKYLWLMDDDSIPHPQALESLEGKAKNLKDQFSFIASSVLWTDGTPCLMNLPVFLEPIKNKRVEFLSDAVMHLLPIISSSFVGCFVNSTISKQVGLPIAEFFIYGDDVEYTMRLSSLKPGYLDTDSIIVHKTGTNLWPDITKMDIEKIDRAFYSYRNGMYLARKAGVTGTMKRLGKVLKQSALIVAVSNHKAKRLTTLFKGTLAGITFNPSIEFSTNNC